LPSTRPDLGGRRGMGGGSGLSSALPAVAGGALGAGLANRIGDKPAATLPGLGDGGGRPRQLPAERPLQERRQGLHCRPTGEGGRGENFGDRLSGDNRTDRQEGRGDRQQTRDDRQQTRQDTRGDRQEGRQDTRGDRQGTRNERQENRQDTRGQRQE